MAISWGPEPNRISQDEVLTVGLSARKVRGALRDSRAALWHMEIVLNDPDLIPDLLSFLEEEGFVAVEGDHGTVNASPAPGSFREDHVRMELELRLAIWRSRYSDVTTELTLQR